MGRLQEEEEEGKGREGWAEERWGGCFGRGALDALCRGKGPACCQPAEPLRAAASHQPGRESSWEPGLVGRGAGMCICGGEISPL